MCSDLATEKLLKVLQFVDSYMCIRLETVAKLIILER